MANRFVCTTHSPHATLFTLTIPSMTHTYVTDVQWVQFPPLFILLPIANMSRMHSSGRPAQPLTNPKNPPAEYTYCTILVANIYALAGRCSHEIHLCFKRLKDTESKHAPLADKGYCTIPYCTVAYGAEDFSIS